MKNLSQYPTAPMSNEVAQTFIGLYQAPDDPDPEIQDALDADAGCRIIQGRCNQPIDYRVLMLTSVLSAGNPGRCVMWAYTIHKLKYPNWLQFVIAFGDGFPTGQSYESCWNDQKCCGANGLDMERWV